MIIKSRTIKWVEYVACMVDINKTSGINPWLWSCKSLR